MRSKYLLLIGAAIGVACLGLLLASTGAEAWQSGDIYPGTGSWTVTNPTVLADQTLTVAGNVAVNGELSIYNATLRISSTSDGLYTLNVSSTGDLKIYRSNVTAASTSYHYRFTVFGKLHVNESTISEMWGDKASWTGGVQLHSDGAVVENTTVTLGPVGGISIWNCSARLLNDNITNNGAGGSTTYAYGVYIKTSDFTACEVRGNRIHNNTYASGTSRYGHGIRSEYQNPNDTIAGNTIADNGFTNATTPQGYGLYLLYSRPTLAGNAFFNGRYQMYASYSTPPEVSRSSFSIYINLASCYHVYSTNSKLAFRDCSFTGTYLNQTFYGFYSNTNSPLDLMNCTFEYPNKALGVTWTGYIVYSGSYSPLNVTDCTFLVNLQPRATAPVLGSVRIYIIYAFTYSPANISGCSFSATSSYYNYGVRTTSYSPLTIRNCTFDLSDVQDPGGTSGTVYAAYSMTSSPLTMEDCSLSLNMGFSQYTCIHVSGSNNLVRNVQLSIVHDSSATRKWSYAFFSPAGGGISSGVDPSAKAGGDWGTLVVENCTGSASATCTGLHGLQWFSCGNLGLSILNCSFSSTDGAGLNAMGAFAFSSNSKVYINDSSFDIDLGGGANATPGSFLPIGLADIRLLELNNSTVTFSILGDAVNLPLAYLEGACGELAFRGSRLEARLDAPGSSLVLFRFMRLSSGLPSLQKLTVVGSSLTATASSEDCTLGFIHLWLGSSLKSSEMRDAEVSLTLQQPSSRASFGIDLYKVNTFGLANFTLKLNAPGGPGTEFLGIRFQLSSPTVSNITFQGNGLGKITGILCDLVSRPSLERLVVDSAHSGLRSEFYSLPTASSCTFSRVEVGLSTDARGNATLAGCKISASGKGLVLGGSSWATLIDSSLVAASTDIELDGGSTAWLVNCTFDADRVLFRDGGSLLAVGWWLDLEVTWQNGVGIAGADLSLRDVWGNEVLRSATGAGGRLPILAVLQYFQTSVSKDLHGPYTASASFLDLDGAETFFVNSSIERAVVIRDDVPPLLTVVEPSDGHVQADEWLYLVGTASDRGSGLAWMEFSLDGTAWVRMPASARWEHLLFVPEGRYDLRVRAVDVAGNELEVVLDVTVDLTAPFITVTSPADGSTGSAILVHLQGQVEPGSRLTVNSAPVEVGTDGSFSFPASLVEGGNLFILHAEDRARNSNSTTLTLVLDITPPSLELSSPADRLLTNVTEVQVTGSTEAGASVKVNGAPVPVGPDGSFSITLTLVPGWNDIAVLVSDPAGNSNAAVRTVFLDPSLLLAVSEPADGMLTGELTLLVRGTTDPDALVRLNGVTITIDPAGAFRMTYALSEGANLLVFEASDRAGNQCRLAITVVLDTLPPALEVLSPLSGAVLASKQVQVRGTCEPGSVVSVNGQAAPVEGGAFSVDLTLTEGAHAIEVECRDRAGNAARLTVPVTVDLTPPALALTDPPAGFRASAGTVTVSGHAEPGAEVRVNGVPVGVGPDGRFSAAVAVDGARSRITVTARDPAGNEVTREVPLTVVPGPAPPGESALEGIWTPAGQLLALGVLFPLLGLAVHLRLRRKAGGGG